MIEMLTLLIRGVTDIDYVLRHNDLLIGISVYLKTYLKTMYKKSLSYSIKININYI